ncbi:NitT/TauT family transport system permease protein [Conyzicola lurida]|uniref:NitT/TauT family transport system permease protein n=1 Tax=Conyzicola lurida TaxID=1172621 RepID=A0A841AMD6_9MICO|nr:ABC transporter permease [Conyzicola lurida]MBB5843488.1 NitT/TauT family transport system permease protein [Conyzicola lurida]
MALMTPTAAADTAASAPALPVKKRGALPKRLAFIRPAIWLPVVVLVGALGFAWNVVAKDNPYLLPPLAKVGEALASNPGFYIHNAWVTLSVALVGLAIGFVTSYILAILISELPIARRAIMPVAVVLNVTPLVAIAPALVVAFGFGPEPKLIVTALICFFPILINVSTGLRSVPQSVVQVFTTIHASRVEMLWHVRMPSALPFLFTALRIVFPLSIIGAVVAELAAPGAAEGLGTVISIASSNNRLPVVYAAILCLAILGSVLLAVITAVERRVLHWHESMIGEKS